MSANICIYKQTRISDNGNVIEVSTWHKAPQTHRMLFNTRGMGDRRQRKAAAKAWLNEHVHRRVYAVYHLPMSIRGSIRRIEGNITITV